MAKGKKKVDGTAAAGGANAAPGGGAAPVAAATAADTITDADREKYVVRTLLQNKRGELAEVELELRARLVSASRDEGQLILPTISQVVLEIAYIMRRLAALRANEPFKPVSSADEKALEEAIRAVADATDANAASVALVTATLKLVNTYRAKATDPAA